MSLLVGLFFVAFAQAQYTFQVDTILNNGPKSNRINLVYLGDGYTASQQTQFIADVNANVNLFFNVTPLKEYKSFFNVYAVRVISPQSGARHDSTAADCGTATPPVPKRWPGGPAQNYFGSMYDYGGTHRLLYAPNTAAINNVLNANTPWYDKAMILVNSPYYGGSGGTYSIASNNTSSAEIMIHEFGHSFAGLADEYGGAYCTGTEKPNVTQNINPATIKWSQWLTPGIALPTLPFTNCTGVGAYNGANYCNNGWYRPQCDCKMRTLGQLFCAVCKQEFVKKIWDYIGANAIENPIPASSTDTVYVNGAGNQTFTANVLNTTTSTIKRKWYVNNQLVETETGATTSFLFAGASYANGVYTVKLEAKDTTGLNRKYTLPTTTKTWIVKKTGNLSGLPPTIVTVNTVNPTCGQPNGSVTVALVMGTAPFTYSWGNGFTTNGLAGLSPGTYNVTVSNQYGQATGSYTLTNQGMPFNFQVNNPTICQGQSATLTTSNLLATYTWAPATGLSSTTGAPITASPTVTTTYTVTGTYQGCTNQTTATVFVATPPSVSITLIDTPCVGQTNGILTANSPNAIANWFWSNGATSQIITNVGEGTYTVTAYDGMCTVSASKAVFAKNCTVTPGNCTPPQGLTVETTCPHTKFVWTPTAPSPGGYKLRYRKTNVTNAPWTYIVTNLTYATKTVTAGSYETQVMSYCNTAKTDSSVYSAPLAFTVVNTTQPPTFTITNIMSSSFKMTFTTHTGNNYTYQKRVVGTTSWGPNIYFTPLYNGQYYNIFQYGLTPNTAYEFRIRANCTSGYSTWVPFNVTTNSANLRTDGTEAIRVAPNPTSGTFTVYGTYQWMKLFNAAGQLVYTSANHSAYYNLKHLPKGTYVIEFNTGENFKLVFQ